MAHHCHTHSHGALAKEPCRASAQIAIERMRAQGLRVTEPRIAILEHLGACTSPCSIQEMADVLGSRCDWATIFRTVRKLEEIGLLRGHDLGDKQRRYEISALDAQHHHHFLVCRQCNQMETLEHCCVDEFVAELQRQTGFTQITHSLEFFGLCKQCSVK